jgi:hypothetical protein
MSSPPPVPNANWYPPEPPRSGCGGTLLKGCGCGCLLVVLLCVGSLVGTYYWVTKSVSNDPAQARAMTLEIARIDIPASLVPAGSLPLKIPLVEKLVAKGVWYEDSGTHSLLILGSGPLLNAGNPEQTRIQFQKSFRMQQPGEHAQGLIDEHTEQKELTVKGQTTTFVFTEGKDAKTRAKRLEVIGLFPGQEGTAVFFFIGDAEKYTAEKIKALIESIH